MSKQGSTTVIRQEKKTSVDVREADIKLKTSKKKQKERKNE